MFITFIGLSTLFLCGIGVWHVASLRVANDFNKMMSELSIQDFIELRCSEKRRVDRDYFITLFYESYGEVPVALGMLSQKRLFEVSAAESGKWTGFITYPDKKVCPVFVGESWVVSPEHILTPW